MDRGVSKLRTMEGNHKEDRISKVPRDLMACILEHLPVQHAVRTCVLSRNWRYKWASIRNFTFDKNFLNYLQHDKSLPTSVYFQAIHNILLRHQDTIDSFTLYIPGSGSPILSPTTDMYNCLHLLSIKSVKELTIHYDTCLEMHKEDDNRVLAPLYSCTKLIRLAITNCGFFPPPSFNGFPNLVFLRCDSLTFCNDSFDCLMSSCPFLEVLSLFNCRGPAAFEIYSTRLKHIELSASSGSITNINAENLESLAIYSQKCGTDDYASVRLLSSVESLGDLWFSDLRLDNMGSVSSFLGLIHAAPNLQNLTIVTTPAEVYNLDRAINQLEANMNRKLVKLKKVDVQIFDGSDDELILIKLLLALSPSLEKMILFVEEDDDAVWQTLEKFPKASPTAELLEWEDSDEDSDEDEEEEEEEDSDEDEEEEEVEDEEEDEDEDEDEDEEEEEDSDSDEADEEDKDEED